MGSKRRSIGLFGIITFAVLIVEQQHARANFVGHAFANSQIELIVDAGKNLPQKRST